MVGVPILPVFAMRGVGLTEYVYISTMIGGFADLFIMLGPPVRENGDRNESTVRSKLSRITGLVI